MINYTATIFAESGSDVSPNLSAIICGAIQLLGTLVSTKLVDRAGRKVYSTVHRLTGLKKEKFQPQQFSVPINYIIAWRWTISRSTRNVHIHEFSRLFCATVFLGRHSQFLINVVPSIVWNNSATLCNFS